MEKLRKEAIEISVKITHLISEGNFREASDLRLLLNYKVDQLLKLKRLYTQALEKMKDV